MCVAEPDKVSSPHPMLYICSFLWGLYNFVRFHRYGDKTGQHGCDFQAVQIVLAIVLTLGCLSLKLQSTHQSWNSQERAKVHQYDGTDVVLHGINDLSWSLVWKGVFAS